MEPSNYFAIADQMLKAAADPSKGLTAAATTARVMRLGCTGLKELAKDMMQGGDIEWARSHLSQIHRLSLNQQLDDYERSARQMLDVFLLAEDRYFEKCGVPPDLRRFIVCRAREFKSEFWDVELLEGPTWSRIQQEIQALAQEVCKYSQDLAALEAYRGYAKRGAFVLAGAGVMKLNASADALMSGFLAPWMTAKSGKLGAWLMKKGGVDKGEEGEA